MSSLPVLGLDIGGTNLKVVALELPNRIRREFKIPSLASRGPEGVRQALRTVRDQLGEEGLRFQAVGVGCAGSVCPRTGVVRNSPNFSHWKDVPLRDWCEEDFGIPAVVENDANCAAVTEWQLGAARGCRHVLLLTLGTGIGGGLILDGKLYRGATGTASEVGHMTLVAKGIPCPCGNVGCFERYASASALAVRVPGVTPRVIFHPDNYERYREVIEDFLIYLESGLVGLANTFDPEVILLGGAITNGLGPHLERIRASVKKRAFPAVASTVRIEPTQFGNNSGALGAALLAFSESGSRIGTSVLC